MNYGNSRRPVVLLDAGRGMALGVIHALKDVGEYDITAVALERRGNTCYSRQCRHILLSDWDWNGTPEQLNMIAAAQPGAILLPVSTRAVLWVSRFRDCLLRSWKLPTLSDHSTLLTTIDKLSLAKASSAYGISVPPYVGITPSGALDHSFPIPYPVLLKPREGAGGIGIEKIESQQALSLRLSTLKDPHRYFIQQWLPGDDISCGVLCDGGSIVAAASYVCLARHEEFGPFSSIKFLEDSQVLETVRTIMHRLKWHGIANLDLRRGKDGTIHLLEINPRAWGNILGSLRTGINFADLWCRSTFESVPALMTSAEVCHFGSRDSLRMAVKMLLRDSVQTSMKGLFSLWRSSALRYVLQDPLPRAVGRLQSSWSGPQPADPVSMAERFSATDSRFAEKASVPLQGLSKACNI